MNSVIKQGESNPQLIRRLENVNVSDHLAEVRLLVETAREKARKILAETREEAQVIRKEAADRGFEAGFRRGYESGQQAGRDAAHEEASARFNDQQETLVRSIGGMIDEFERIKRDLYIAARQDVVRFAIDVAKRVTHRVGRIGSESAVANIDAALKCVAVGTDLQIHVNPRDADAANDFAKRFTDDVGHADHVSIVADDTVSCGGCKLVTAECDVDATLETQLRRFVEQVGLDGMDET